MKTLIPHIILLCLTLTTPGWAGFEVPVQSDGKCRHMNNQWEPVNGKCDQAFAIPNWPESNFRDNTVCLTSAPHPPGTCINAHDWRGEVLPHFHISMKPDPCLAQMQEAMYWMELYIPTMKAYDPWLEKNGPNQRTKTFEQWDAAKKACWKETK